MKKFQNLILAIFSLVALFACRPQPDENGYMLHGLGTSGTGTGGTGGTTGTTKVISKMNTFDGNGKAFSYIFGYANKSLAKITTTDNSYTSDITYTSGKISKVVTVVFDSSASETTTITSNVSYNSAGNISKVDATEVLTMNGSVINTTQKTSTYTYNSNNQITKVVQDYNVAGMSTQTATLDYTYSGNNLSKMVLSTQISLSPLPPLVVTTDFSNYDSKISPASTLSKNYADFSLSEAGIGLTNSPNNPGIITVTESLMGTVTPTTLTYTYDAQNYATSVTSNGETTSYEYTLI